MPFPFTLTWSWCAWATLQGRSMSLYNFLLGCAWMREPVWTMYGKDASWFWTGGVSDYGIFGRVCLVSFFLTNWSHRVVPKTQQFSFRTLIHQKDPKRKALSDGILMACGFLPLASWNLDRCTRACLPWAAESSYVVPAPAKDSVPNSAEIRPGQCIAKQVSNKPISQYGSMCNGSFDLKLGSLPPFITIWWGWWGKHFEIYSASFRRQVAVTKPGKCTAAGRRPAAWHCVVSFAFKNQSQGCGGIGQLVPLWHMGWTFCHEVGKKDQWRNRDAIPFCVQKSDGAFLLRPKLVTSADAGQSFFFIVCASPDAGKHV